jgi:hypothetical protein
MYEIYTKEYLSIEKNRFLFQGTSVVRRKTMSYEQENDELCQGKRRVTFSNSIY